MKNYVISIQEDKNTITYEADAVSCKKVIYPVYAEASEITFIMQDIIQKDTEKLISTEVIGFYYGCPDIETMKSYIGELKAEF